MKELKYKFIVSIVKREWKNISSVRETIFREGITTLLEITLCIDSEG